MAGAALQKEISAMWSRDILPGCKNSLFTVIFISQIKMSIMSLPCLVLFLVLFLVLGATYVFYTALSFLLEGY